MAEVLFSAEPNGIVVLTLNAPAKRNALSMEMRAQLLALLDRCLAQDDCRVIVLTGAERTFCAGGDVSQMAPPPGVSPAEHAERRFELLHDVVRRIAAGAKPVIAAVEGHAAGAGLSLAAACDYVVAADGAKFIASFGKIGLIADCGLLWSLPRRVGHSRATDILLTARTVPSQEAVACGLADEQCADGAALETAVRAASRYRSVAPLSIKYTKLALSEGHAELESALKREKELQNVLRSSSDHKEARDAFLEKRTAVFHGR